MMKRIRLFYAVSALALAALACSLASQPEEVIPTPVPPTPLPAQPTATTAPDSPPPTEGSASLSGSQRQQLVSSTVLILMSDLENGQYVPYGIGSGTIISSDGLILTNAHVASPAAIGYEADPDALIVALNENESSPPVPSYIAEVQAVDGYLDLAVIRITANLDGSAVGSDSLNLPFVQLGNSDDLHLGDNVYIFGFPGIGGETITFTRGSVSGFTSEPPVGDRAWIKTDATIAGGNSGGLAANDLGQIVGVPTRGGSGTDVDIADCRIVQDTNGDGRLDQNDTCIPIGGFINALRPVNFAVPLVRAAQTGVAYVSPYAADSSSGTTGSGSESFSLVDWSVDYDEDSGCALSPAASFPSGIEQLTAVFSYSGMTDGQDFSLYWLLDGSTVVEETFAWEYGPSDPCFPFFIHNSGEALPDGQYTLLLLTGNNMDQVAEVRTTVGAGAPGTSGNGTVTVDGYIYDADSGQPIEDATIVILFPGLDPDAWLDSGSESDIYTMATTDSSGYFRFPDALMREVDYPALAGASPQGYTTTTGFIYISSDDPDIVTYDIELYR